MKSKRTKACEITPEVRQRVEERDGGKCIFCFKPGRGEAHFVKRSQGGLGIETNIVTACRWCHHQMDDGFYRDIYIQRAQDYLKEKYPDWKLSDQIYHKGFEYD